MKLKMHLLACMFILLLHTTGNSQDTISTGIKQSPLEMDSILKQGPEYELIKPLAGHWMVIQTVYSKQEGKILVRDTFTVDRKMMGNFLQETMQPIAEKDTKPFTRMSYLNYNRTNSRWEYIVLDTRYPVMMFETSADPRVTADNNIHLYLDAFIVPPFLGKEYAGMLGKEHRIITFKSNDINIHRQYWVLPTQKEFLAIEYIFKRK